MTSTRNRPIIEVTFTDGHREVFCPNRERGWTPHRVAGQLLINLDNGSRVIIPFTNVAYYTVLPIQEEP